MYATESTIQEYMKIRSEEFGEEIDELTAQEEFESLVRFYILMRQAIFINQ
ncbi:MAG: hypothetical protein AAF927_02250 [Bacteroidota bacterium]